ncbi:hypothetical protein [Chamaesiphon sp. OTE_75_metabat_556]|uniref:hypothetical protein n=1 Tax=Chamaesiphon sp. OTE_75_metabat_556 TaxID=2964692 RepID=UPI00286C5D78|nr:hypothetical protein [Chamaesiphon sp. OTE_75_metabat_556]
MIAIAATIEIAVTRVGVSSNNEGLWSDNAIVKPIAVAIDMEIVVTTVIMAIIVAIAKFRAANADLLYDVRTIQTDSLSLHLSIKIIQLQID